ncbi:nickel pincer cofactor biosynthesis protein LarB [Stieleria sp. TO1_6]|nr:nickel pincer cofactor biosynthesis protein LarB [Stieleria tagensis]
MPPHPPPKTAPRDLAQWLTDVATGRCSVAEAMANLANPVPQSLADPSDPAGPTADRPLETTAHVTLDLDRQRRCGFPEVIYGDGKPPEMMIEIIRRQQHAGQPSFATRVAPQAADSILTAIPQARFNPLSRTLTAGIPGQPQPLAASGPDPTAQKFPHHVAVITAGSTDAPVAEEAIETLHWMKIPFRSFDDIGVAGPARLIAAVPALRQASAVIVIAGMEGALPAAVGGHLCVPVFAVPTSVGYGATLGGLTPLMGMLSSCASNVAVVNIDAGFKAAYLAGLVARPIDER